MTPGRRTGTRAPLLGFSWAAAVALLGAGSPAPARAEQLKFFRGDANASGSLDLSDAVATFNFLFLGGAAVPCTDAADSNDDGAVDLSDGIYSLQFLFTGGPPPKPPGHLVCGTDPTPDALTCATYEAPLCEQDPDPSSYPREGRGIFYEYLEPGGSLTALPDFDDSATTPIRSGILETFSLSPRLRSDNFAFRFTGYLEIPRAGRYTFSVTSDDGSELHVNGVLVVDHGGVHAASERSGSLELEPGLRPLSLLYFDATGTERLEVSWEGPGLAKEPIPPEALHVSPHVDLAPEYLGSGTVSRDAELLYAYAPCIFYDETEGLYKWWACYSGPAASGGGDYISYKEAPSLEELAGAPLRIALAPSHDPGYFDDVHACDPNVIRAGTKYYLYYSGNTSDTVLPERTRHGVAVSTDGGRTFTRLHGGVHIVEPDPEYTDGYGAGQSAVVEASDGNFYMIYTDADNNYEGLRVIRSMDPGFAPGTHESVKDISFGDAGGASLDLVFDPEHEEFIVVSNATPGFSASEPSLKYSAVKLTYYDRNWNRLRSRTLAEPDAGYSLGEGIGMLTDSRRRLRRHDLGGIPSLVFAAGTWEPEPCEIWACWIVNNHLYAIFRDWEADLPLDRPVIISEGTVFGGVAGDVVNTGVRLSIANTFTLELWARPEGKISLPKESASGAAGTSGGLYAVFPAHGNDWGDDHAGMGVSVGTNGVAVYEHDGGYLPALLTWQAGIRDWVHLAVVYSEKTPHLYVNGRLVRIGLQSPKGFVHPSVAQIGGGGYGYYRGRIADVRVWDRDFLREDIEEHLVENEPSSLPGLVGQWLHRNTVREKSARGTAVVDLQATGGPGGRTYTYSLRDDAGGRFAVNAASGLLTVASGALLDAQSASEHRVVVAATDDLGEAFEQPLDIRVTQAR